MEIEDWRREIDAIDEELLRLMKRRAHLALEIGALKRRAGLPLCDPSREREILGRMRSLNDGVLDDEALTAIFRRLIRESLRVQRESLERLEVANEAIEILP